MSGGFFNYNQYQIRNIWEEIQLLLDRQGKEKTKEELLLNKEFYEEFPEQKLHMVFPEKIQEVMKNAVKHLKIAEVYAKRIDWYICGDDSEQSLLDNLEKDVEKLNN